MRTVGRYELLEVIGRGGAAVVYLALQQDLRRRVALKELAPLGGDSDRSFALRFSQESRVAGSLSHPNVVTVFEFLEEDGVPYIAMEYLSRGSLRQYVGSLSLAQIAGVLEGVLAGLAHGQSRFVVHRDLKPENLLVTGDGRVKIADFGVARAYADALTSPVVTAMGTTIGTPAYMAPEQALGQEVGPAADLYSLGIVAWELFVGRVPFEERDAPVAVLYRHVHEPVPPVRSLAPGVDPRIEAWLEWMLAKDPGDRFPSAEAAWEELEVVVLELLGPLWRRDARLPVIDAEAEGRPLTPAVFNDGRVAPARATVHRPGRRHDDDEEKPADRPHKRSIRRTVAIVAALGVIAGAAALVVVLSSSAGKTAASPAASRAQVTALLNRVLSTTMITDDRDEHRLDTARTPPAMAAAAGAEQRVWEKGLKELDAQPAALRNATRTRSIEHTAEQLAQSFGAAARALRARNDPQLHQAAAQIGEDAHTLGVQVRSFGLKVKGLDPVGPNVDTR